jgi:hypothetical protein
VEVIPCIRVGYDTHLIRYGNAAVHFTGIEYAPAITEQISAVMAFMSDFPINALGCLLSGYVADVSRKLGHLLFVID